MRELCSPVSYTHLAQEEVREICTCKEDHMRNLYMNLKGNSQGGVNIMLDAHSDEVGSVSYTHLQILEMQKACREVFVHDSLYHYIIQLLQATRNNQRIYRGASPRAGVALLDMSKACALLQGRDYVVPEDIQNVFVDTIAHRILMQPSHSIDAAAAKDALTQLQHHIQPVSYTHLDVYKRQVHQHPFEFLS